MINNKKTNPILFWLGAILLVSFAILMLSKVYESKIPKIVEEINNGAIGAILTAIITVFLLSRQTEINISIEKSSKVFEKKLEIYEKFLDRLNHIIKDNKIGDEEENELLFQLAIIETHTKGENTNKIVEHLNSIIILLRPDEDDNKVVINKEGLSNALFDIVGIFQEELYGERLRADGLKTLHSNVKEVIHNVEEAKEKWAKTVFNNFEEYEKRQKERGTTPKIIQLIREIDTDIKRTFDNVQVKMSPTNYSFWIGKPARNNKFFSVTPEKDKLYTYFDKRIFGVIPTNAGSQSSWPNQFYITYSTFSEYEKQIKELAREVYNSKAKNG